MPWACCEIVAIGYTVDYTKRFVCTSTTIDNRFLFVGSRSSSSSISLLSLYVSQSRYSTSMPEILKALQLVQTVVYKTDRTMTLSLSLLLSWRTYYDIDTGLRSVRAFTEDAGINVKTNGHVTPPPPAFFLSLSLSLWVSNLATFLTPPSLHVHIGSSCLCCPCARGCRSLLVF